MKVYIAGKITGNPNYQQQFAEAEKWLLSIGYKPINPAKNECQSYKEYIDTGLKQLMDCEAIYLLPNYQDSKGALLEYQYAITTETKIIERSENIQHEKTS